MSKRKHVPPGAAVPVKLTSEQRALILDTVSCLDSHSVARIRDVADGGPLLMTLDDYDVLSGYIAAEANHCDDRKLQKKLDVIFRKVEAVLQSYTDERSDGGA